MGRKLREAFTAYRYAAPTATVPRETQTDSLPNDEYEMERAKDSAGFRGDISTHYVIGGGKIARREREREEKDRLAREAEQQRREKERLAAEAEAAQRRREAEERERREKEAAEAQAQRKREAQQEARRQAEKAEEERRRRRRHDEAAAAAARVAAVTSAPNSTAEAVANPSVAAGGEDEGTARGTGAGADADADADAGDAAPLRSDAYLEVVSKRRARAEAAEKRAAEIRRDRDMASMRAAVRLRGAGQVSKLSATEKQVETVAGGVVKFFQAELTRFGSPAFEYAAFQVAGRLIDYARDPQSDCVAFAAARTSRLIEAHVEGFEEVLECAIARACPLLAGQWLHRSDYSTADEFNRAFGHRAGEDSAAFRAAIHALARFCGARWQARDERGGGQSAPAIGDAWRWLARTLNRAPRTETMPAFLSPALLGVLATAGRELNFQYRANFAKLVRYLQRFILPRLPRGGNDVPDVARHHDELCRVVETFAAQAGKRDFPVPSGLPLPLEDARNT